MNIAIVEHHVNILLLLGIAVFVGSIGGKLFQYMRIPQVVGFIVIGLVVGQTGFGLMPIEVVHDMRPLSMFALGLIGFLIGRELRLPDLRKRGKQFMTILLAEGISAFIIVGVSTAMIIWLLSGDTKRSLAMGLLLGAISSATAPAATVSVLWEYKTRGPLTSTLLAIVALDDGLGLLLFGFAASVADVLLSGSNLTFGAVLGAPAYEIFTSITIGGVSALLLNQLLRWSSDHEKQLVFTLGIIMLNMGLSVALKIDAILAAMALGTVLANLAPHHSRDAFDLIKKLAPPIFVLFFTLVGAELQLFNTHLHTWIVAGVYVLCRTFGKIAGAYYGARTSGAPETVRRYLGFGLFAQGGVAVGLSILAALRFESSIGNEIIVIVTVTTMLVELIGPPFVKLAVTKAGEVGLDINEDDIIRSYTVANVMDCNPPVVSLNDRIEKILKVIGSSDTYLHYPVIDHKGALQGVISLNDLKHILSDHSVVSNILIAYDLMTECNESVTPDTPLMEAINCMRNSSLGFLPVVEGDGTNKIVGFLDHRLLDKVISAEMLRRRQTSNV